MLTEVVLMTSGPDFGNNYWSDDALKEAAEKFVGMPVKLDNPPWAAGPVAGPVIGKIISASFEPAVKDKPAAIIGLIEVPNPKYIVSGYAIDTASVVCKVCGKEISKSEDSCEHIKPGTGLKYDASNELGVHADPKEVYIKVV